MPGYNQRGPMNEGPMTGRKRGVCMQDSMASGRYSQPGAQGAGMGMGNRRGRGRCQFQPAGQGWGNPWESRETDGQMTPKNQKQVLRDRARELEAELSAIKSRLGTLPDQDGPVSSL